MTQPESPQDPVLKQLQLITRILTIAHADRVANELAKIATTDDRKKMWILIDGKQMSRDIARKLNVSDRAVNYFLREATLAGFVENPRRKPPAKLIDFTPPSWLPLGEGLEEASGEDRPQGIESATPAGSDGPRTE
jgi:hypothetical protein